MNNGNCWQDVLKKPWVCPQSTDERWGNAYQVPETRRIYRGALRGIDSNFYKFKSELINRNGEYVLTYFFTSSIEPDLTHDLKGAAKRCSISTKGLIVKIKQIKKLNSWQKRYIYKPFN